LDEQAELNLEGTLQRACESCFVDWVGYSQGAPLKRRGEETQTSVMPVAAGRKTGKDAAGSVPKDWSWSTF
jgi:hypothetical protein